jgi:hypothetical protein
MVLTVHPHKDERPAPSVRGKNVEIDSLDAALARFYKQIFALPSEQQEKALQFHAVYMAYLVRLYRRKELPIGRYTPN